ncbi:hypothetical protein ACLOJK_039014 [Asimina triloba]
MAPQSSPRPPRNRIFSAPITADRRSTIIWCSIIQHPKAMEPITIQHHPRQVRTSRIHRHQAARPISSGGRLQRSASHQGPAAGQRSSVVFFQARPPAARLSGAWPTRAERTMASINPRLADIHPLNPPTHPNQIGHGQHPVSSSSVRLIKEQQAIVPDGRDGQQRAEARRTKHGNGSKAISSNSQGRPFNQHSSEHPA